MDIVPAIPMNGFRVVRDGGANTAPKLIRPKAHTAKAFYDMLKPIYEHEDAEIFGFLAFDGRGQIIQGPINVGRGAVDCVVAMPREVFRQALTLHSVTPSGIIVYHNHPWGNPSPSTEDIQVTKRMIFVGEALGLLVLDHIIIGTDSYYSFSEQSQLFPCTYREVSLYVSEAA